ncbi:MAG: NYN domain-containing protein [Chloroflexota bacterium]|nr:NYN domain-containing protein [Chloroflexota bacterium]
MRAPMPYTLPRANVYIDGFNLYHACFDDHGGRAHWRQYRWLDLGTLCEKLFPDYQINRIRYFTALVDPFPNNPDNRARQLEYLRALRTIPHLTEHRGRFATHAKDRPLADPNAITPTPLVPFRMAHVIEREEKGSDVNLASYMLVDGFKKEYDVAIVVTNDSDLAEPICLVRTEVGRKVMLVNPRTTVAVHLKGIADTYKHIRIWVLRDSQFPPTLNDEHGTITKPATW